MNNNLPPDTEFLFSVVVAQLAAPESGGILV